MLHALYCYTAGCPALRRRMKLFRRFCVSSSSTLSPFALLSALHVGGNSKGCPRSYHDGVQSIPVANGAPHHSLGECFWRSLLSPLLSCCSRGWGGKPRPAKEKLLSNKPRKMYIPKKIKCVSLVLSCLSALCHELPHRGTRRNVNATLGKA